MISANQRLVLSREMESIHTAPKALTLVLADDGFNEPIDGLNLTENDYRELSLTLRTQGPAAVVKEIKERQALDREVDRISQAVDRWKKTRPEYCPSPHNRELLLAFLENPESFGYFMDERGLIRYSKDGSVPATKLSKAEAHLAGLRQRRIKTTHPDMIKAENEVKRLKAEAATSRANSNLDITVKNLETAFVALSAAGRLEEEVPAQPPRPYFVGQINPSAAADADIDMMPTKKVGNMSADEFARAVVTSKQFREKVDGKTPTAAPASATEAEKVLAKKTSGEKQELQRKINQMSSRAYDEWVKQPGNQTLVDSLYATA